MTTEFDYIIVGGGTAGLVLAGRLSEIPDAQVLVLEAGTDRSRDPNIVVPGMSWNTWADPTLIWPFMSVPQPDVKDRVIPLFRGKALGGCSAINAMIAGRASKREYDALDTELGNKLESSKHGSWNWDGLVEYFRKSETLSSNSTNLSSTYYKPNPDVSGTSGPIHRSAGAAGYTDPIHLTVFDTLKQDANVPIVMDPMDATDNIGSGVNPGAINPTTGTRSYSASGYYDPIKSTRGNLTVWTEVKATRVLLSGSGSEVKVEGVEYVSIKANSDGEKKTVKARKEVISCAGSFQSPQLLENSGIGSKQVLEKAGVEVKVELDGVGENLQDHVSTFIMAEITGDSSIETADGIQVVPVKVPEADAEIAVPIDPGMSRVLTQGFSWLPAKYYTDEKTVDEWTKASTLFNEKNNTKGGSKKTVELQTKWIGDEEISSLELAHIGGFYPLSPSPKEQGKRYFTLIVALAHPLSRGSVHITPPTENGSENLEINNQFLSNPVDLQMLLSGLKFIKKLKFDEKLGLKEVCPGPAPEGENEDAFLENYLKSSLSTVFHPAGSCSMMRKEDGGVVDERCRVYGVKGLRVVDASIMPFEFAAHPCATIYAIAEKAADIIKEDF